MISTVTAAQVITLHVERARQRSPFKCVQAMGSPGQLEVEAFLTECWKPSVCALADAAEDRFVPFKKEAAKIASLQREARAYRELAGYQTVPIYAPRVREPWWIRLLGLGHYDHRPIRYELSADGMTNRSKADLADAMAAQIVKEVDGD